jgi:hypothetical protein
MPVKLASVDDLKTFTPGTAVPKSFILDLINKNYYNTKKKRRGQGPANPGDDMKNHDARCCWFPYIELEKLFIANGFNEQEKDKFGVRIYYGMHDKDHSFHHMTHGTQLPDVKYDGQHTVILVVTKIDSENKNADQLNEGFNSLSYGGQGMDIGSLCPPACDGGQTW